MQNFQYYTDFVYKTYFCTIFCGYCLQSWKNGYIIVINTKEYISNLKFGSANMDENRVIVQLGGQQFSICGEESEEYIKKTAQYANHVIQQVQQSYPSISTLDCALLAALQLSDELQKLKDDYEALDSRIAMLRNMPREQQAPIAPVKRPFEKTTTAK